MRALTAGRYRYHTWPEFREHKGSLVRPSPPLPCARRLTAGQFTLNCGLALAAFVDLLTTAILTYYLRRNMRGFERCVPARVWGGEGRG